MKRFIYLLPIVCIYSAIMGCSNANDSEYLDFSDRVRLEQEMEEDDQHRTALLDKFEETSERVLVYKDSADYGENLLKISIEKSLPSEYLQLLAEAVKIYRDKENQWRDSLYLVAKELQKEEWGEKVFEFILDRFGGSPEAIFLTSKSCDQYLPFK